MLELLANQEREILESAEERVRVRDAIAAQDEQAAQTTLERHNLLMMVNEQKEKMEELRDSQFNILPKESEREMSEDDLVDKIVRLTVESLATNGPTKSHMARKKHKMRRRKILL